MKWMSLFRKSKPPRKQGAGDQNRQLQFVAYILFAGYGFEDRSRHITGRNARTGSREQQTP